MNASTVFRLAGKDLYLLRRPLLLAVTLGAISVALARSNDHSVRSLGITLALNLFIGMCFHLVIGNVLGEREKKTLAFVLAQPVSHREVTAAKLVSSISMYTLCGLFAAAALVSLSPVGRGLTPHLLGWLAYFGVTLGGFLVLFAIVLGTALVSESLGWTMVVAGGLTFVLGNGLLMFGSRLTYLTAYARNLVHGGAALPATLALEAALLLCLLTGTFWLQERKTSFL
ncbi:MAG: ABC transporter permease subunit [Acidobacteriota bacterium]